MPQTLTDLRAHLAEIQRQSDRNLERQWLRYLLRELPTRGWTPILVDDGEDLYRSTDPEVLYEHLISVDESHLGLRNDETERTVSLFCVLGNCWDELIADYRCPELLVDTLDATLDDLELEFRFLLAQHTLRFEFRS